jgi:hypothetical protein
LNITLIATDSKVSDLSDVSAGDAKAIMENTIATAPRPMFVKGVTFFLLPDDFFVFCKDEDNTTTTIPEAIISTPMTNNATERSITIIFTEKIG